VYRERGPSDTCIPEGEVRIHSRRVKKVANDLPVSFPFAACGSGVVARVSV
jgi:hypothetical protein